MLVQEYFVVHHLACDLIGQSHRSGLSIFKHLLVIRLIVNLRWLQQARPGSILEYRLALIPLIGLTVIKLFVLKQLISSIIAKVGHLKLLSIHLPIHSTITYRQHILIQNQRHTQLRFVKLGPVLHSFRKLTTLLLEAIVGSSKNFGRPYLIGFGVQSNDPLLDGNGDQLEMPHYVEDMTRLQKSMFQLLLEKKAVNCLFDSLLLHFLLIYLLQKEQNPILWGIGLNIGIRTAVRVLTVAFKVPVVVLGVREYETYQVFILIQNAYEVPVNRPEFMQLLSLSAHELARKNISSLLKVVGTWELPSEGQPHHCPLPRRQCRRPDAAVVEVSLKGIEGKVCFVHLGVEVLAIEPSLHPGRLDLHFRNHQGTDHAGSSTLPLEPDTTGTEQPLPRPILLSLPLKGAARAHHALVLLIQSAALDKKALPGQPLTILLSMDFSGWGSGEIWTGWRGPAADSIFLMLVVSRGRRLRVSLAIVSWGLVLLSLRMVRSAVWVLIFCIVEAMRCIAIVVGMPLIGGVPYKKVLLLFGSIK